MASYHSIFYDLVVAFLQRNPGAPVDGIVVKIEQAKSAARRKWPSDGEDAIVSVAERCAWGNFVPWLPFPGDEPTAVPAIQPAPVRYTALGVLDSALKTLGTHLHDGNEEYTPYGPSDKKSYPPGYRRNMRDHPWLPFPGDEPTAVPTIQPAPATYKAMGVLDRALKRLGTHLPSRNEKYAPYGPFDEKSGRYGYLTTMRESGARAGLMFPLFVSEGPCFVYRPPARCYTSCFLGSGNEEFKWLVGAEELLQVTIKSSFGAPFDFKVWVSYSDVKGATGSAAHDRLQVAANCLNFWAEQCHVLGARNKRQPNIEEATRYYLSLSK